MDNKKFANIYLSVCTILFLVGVMSINQTPEETIDFDIMPMEITPGVQVQYLIFDPMEITAEE